MPDLRAAHFFEVRERLIGNRLAVYSAMLENGPCTGTELAARMGWTVLSVRPRVSELEAAFHAIPTGRRRDGEHEFRALSASEAELIHSAARQRFLALDKPAASPAAAVAVGQGELFA